MPIVPAVRPVKSSHSRIARFWHHSDPNRKMSIHMGERKEKAKKRQRKGKAREGKAEDFQSKKFFPQNKNTFFQN